MKKLEFKWVPYSQIKEFERQHPPKIINGEEHPMFKMVCWPVPTREYNATLKFGYYVETE